MVEQYPTIFGHKKTFEILPSKAFNIRSPEGLACANPSQ
jgi:hypothetical protein